MDTVLVVGATGQLGAAAVRQLLARGDCAVRGLVRSPEAKARLEALGAQAALGDLTQPATLMDACKGVTHIIATANAAVPSRPTDTFQSVDATGYHNLIKAAVAKGVRRFIYTSVTASNSQSAFFRAKRATEALLRASRLDAVIFQADIFMDVAFAMMGSEIPVRGTENATVTRPFAFARNHFQRMQDSMEKRRKAAIPGDGLKRHGFICVDDVARFLVAAVHRGSAGTYVLGGPEALGFADVVRIYEGVLGHELRIAKTPAVVFRAMSVLLRPFNPAAANLMFLNYLAATEETFPDQRTWDEFDVRPRKAEQFLRERFARAAAATA